MMRSTYTTEIRDCGPTRFVCVTDLDQGRSVTNDIDLVIDDLVKAGQLTPGDRLIYCDTFGIWDEALIDQHCRFIDYRSLSTTTCDDAIVTALEKGRE